MLSTLFKSKPVIDEATRNWIFDTFSWCIAELDGDFFKKQSKLILPNNTFYPGSATSVEEMGETIFTNTLKYTGMTEWPIKLVSSEQYRQKPMPKLRFESVLRGENCKVSTNQVLKINSEEVISSIDIPFHQSQLNQPQDLIAYIVQIQAQILVTQHGQGSENITLPGGEALLPQAIDLIACFMGFGVIFANTAYQFKGGCGSCNNSNLNRKAALPELETVYALALFTVLKGEDIKVVKKSLKTHLYKTFRQAHKEISLYLQKSNIQKHQQLTSLIANNA